MTHCPPVGMVRGLSQQRGYTMKVYIITKDGQEIAQDAARILALYKTVDGERRPNLMLKDKQGTFIRYVDYSSVARILDDDIQGKEVSSEGGQDK